MKMCPECHKLSRDDDFCSHCGAAVYGHEDFSQGTLSCDEVKGHSHEKTSFSGGTQTASEGYQRGMAEVKKVKGHKGWIVFIIALSFIGSILDEMDPEVFEEIADWLETVLGFSGKISL